MGKIKKAFRLLTSKKWVQVTCLCLLWYSVSSLSGILGKTLMTLFPHPMTLTLVHLLSTSIYTLPLLSLLKLNNGLSCVPKKYYCSFVIPLCIGKIVTTGTDHVALWRIPVSYLHTVKASIPIFTVIICRLVLKERQTSLVYLSLLPIIVGVAISTVTELSFDTVGLLAGFATSFGGSLQNIFNKRLMKLGQVHSFELMAVLSRLPFLILLPIWLVVDGRDLFLKWRAGTLDFGGAEWWLVLLLLMGDGLLNFVQNVLAFSILAIVTPLSYGVASATKRILVISMSLLMLHNPVTPVNISGMVLAIGGVFLYSYSKTRKKPSPSSTNSKMEDVEAVSNLSKIIDKNNSTPECPNEAKPQD